MRSRGVHWGGFIESGVDWRGPGWIFPPNLYVIKSPEWKLFKANNILRFGAFRLNLAEKKMSQTVKKFD